MRERERERERERDSERQREKQIVRYESSATNEAKHEIATIKEISTPSRTINIEHWPSPVGTGAVMLKRGPIVGRIKKKP